jgi:predicted nucleic acid-binding protein
MFTHLFDTSAVVHLYLPEQPKTKRMKTKIEYLVEQRTVHRKATLLIPSFCVAEVFNTFAKLYFRPRESDRALSKEEYESCLTRFRVDIIWEKTLYSYDLNRNHIIAVDEIIPVEHKLAADDEEAHLSTLDILVIAMACELAYIGDPEKVFLITCDRRMKKVFQGLKDAAERDLKRLRVDRIIIGDPKEKRWVPPNVLLLQDATPREFPRVDGQPMMNVR